jgi:hypothetical protein
MKRGYRLNLMVFGDNCVLLGLLGLNKYTMQDLWGRKWHVLM